MLTEETSAEDVALRIAALLPAIMNLSSTLDNEPELVAIDPVELRSTLLWVVDEMCWLASVREMIAGLSWPSDAQARIDRLRAAASVWAAASPVPRDILDTTRQCLEILHPKADERRNAGSGQEER